MGSICSTSRNKFARFADKYKTLEEVQQALKDSGLESSNLIIGIDYTSSNLSQGQKTWISPNLHSIYPDRLNPYQNVISVAGRTLERFDEDKIIPAFGFGSVTTKAHSVFPLLPDTSGRYCYGFQEVLDAYTRITPHVHMSGPTSFVPLIQKAIEIVIDSGGEYHILLIVADGQVTDMRTNAAAIEQASQYPLSIIMVGVGDGPWEAMEHFDDHLPKRRFDNFQFVNYNKVVSGSLRREIDSDVAFALEALMEIPQQYVAIRELGLLGPGKRPNQISPAAPMAPQASSMAPQTAPMAPQVGYHTYGQQLQKQQPTVELQMRTPPFVGNGMNMAPTGASPMSGDTPTYAKEGARI